MNRWESFFIRLRFLWLGGNDLASELSDCGMRIRLIRQILRELQFTPKKKSNWYTSQAGYRVHGWAVDRILEYCAEKALPREILITKPQPF